ncbi:MAG: hypothetical protein AAF456_21100 [Planctomycetota bacterium]
MSVLFIILCVGFADHSHGQTVFQDNGGTVFVIGGNSADEVVITFPSYAPSGHVRVETGSNGTHQFVNPTGIHVILLGGDDDLRLGAIDLPGSIYVNMGDGDDYVYFNGQYSYVGGDLELILGRGADRVRAANLWFQRLEVAGDYTFSTGSGSDWVDVTGINFTIVHERFHLNTSADQAELHWGHVDTGEGIAVNLRGADDSLNAREWHVGTDLYVRRGYGGHKQIDLRDSVVSGQAEFDLDATQSTLRTMNVEFDESLEIQTGHDQDSVEVVSCILGGDASFATGGEQDYLDFEDTQVVGKLGMDLGSGDDEVQLVDVQYGSGSILTIDGGRDTDSVFQLGRSYRGTPDLRRVEITNF